MVGTSHGTVATRMHISLWTGSVWQEMCTHVQLGSCAQLRAEV